MTASNVATLIVASAAAGITKLSAGDVAIAAAAKPGATNGQLLKAIWSTRGAIRVQVAGAEDFGGMGIIKSDLTNVLKNLPLTDAAKFILTPRADGGADLVSVQG